MNIKKVATKKVVLAGLIIVIIAVLIGLFIFFRNRNLGNEKPAPPPSPPPVSTESLSLSDCIFADLVQTDSEMNIDLSKTNIFGGIYTFLRPFSDQKETRILKMKLNKEGKVLNLKDLISELDINIPDEMAKKIGKRYSLLGFFSQLKNKEWELENLGLVLETRTEEREAVRESLNKWEETMPEDVVSLALIEDKTVLPLGKFKGIEFQDGSYKNTTIRYCSLPFNLKKSKAIDYIFTDDKIFITASKKSIYAVIDSL